MAHGDYDALIPMRYGQQSAELLENLGYRVEWQDYGMGHEVCWEEIRDIADWLGRVLAVRGLNSAAYQWIDQGS